MVRHIYDGMMRLEHMRTCFFIRGVCDTYEIQGNFSDFW